MMSVVIRIRSFVKYHSTEKPRSGETFHIEYQAVPPDGRNGTEEAPD
ncbi:MAG: hypothetical protein AB9903_31735 [Vulcanimicrobiota bacterium]